MVDDDYIDRHFGTEVAQYEKCKAFMLLDSGNIGLRKIKARNVKSAAKPGMNLIAFMFQCLSSERNVLYILCMVFVNVADGEYVQSPCSYCGCEDGAFFCSHMLCFLYVMRCIQWTTMSQNEFEEVFPEDHKIVQSMPCLIENIIVRDRLTRQMAQTKRQSKRKLSQT